MVPFKTIRAPSFGFLCDALSCPLKASQIPAFSQSQPLGFGLAFGWACSCPRLALPSAFGLCGDRSLGLASKSGACGTLGQGGTACTHPPSLVHLGSCVFNFLLLSFPATPASPGRSRPLGNTGMSPATDSIPLDLLLAYLVASSVQDRAR